MAKASRASCSYLYRSLATVNNTVLMKHINIMMLVILPHINEPRCASDAVTQPMARGNDQMKYRPENSRPVKRQGIFVLHSVMLLDPTKMATIKSGPVALLANRFTPPSVAIMTGPCSANASTTPSRTAAQKTKDLVNGLPPKSKNALTNAIRKVKVVAHSTGANTLRERDPFSQNSRTESRATRANR